MAWQPYVDELTKHGHLDHGVVLGATDALIWASTPGFALTTYNVEVEVDVDKKQTVAVNEQATLLEIFPTRGQVKSPAGIRINGVKYVATTYDDDEAAAYLKSDDGGACAVKTNQCILIGTYNTKKDKKQTSGNCFNDVAKLAKSLRDAGY